MDRNATKNAPSTAIVLSGGASFGAMQVGMLRTLFAFGVRPDLIVGTSVGAINGAHLAGNPTPEGVEQLAQIWRRLERRHILPFSLSSLLRGFRGSPSMVDPSSLRALLAEHLTYRDLADARVPLHVMATDVASGAPVRLSDGPAIDAILASSAIPGLLPPVRIAGQVLLDGAISSNTPVRAAVDLGATRIIVLPTLPTQRPVNLPHGALDHGLHALTLMLMRQLSEDLQAFSGRAEIVVVPAVDPGSLSPLDFSRGGELIERATDRTREWLLDGGLGRLASSREMRAHLPSPAAVRPFPSRRPVRLSMTRALAA